MRQTNHTNGVLIVVPPGTYYLTDTVRGDLSLNNSMVISGAGSAATYIQHGVCWSFDLVHVSGGNNVTIKGVSLRYGSNLRAAAGGNQRNLVRLADNDFTRALHDFILHQEWFSPAFASGNS